MRQIDSMTPQEIDTLRVKGMLRDPKRYQDLVNRERIQLQQNRIDACNTLIDHILDDIPHKDQQPILDLLRSMRSDLEDEMEDNVSVS